MEHHHPSVDAAALNANGDDTGTYSFNFSSSWQRSDELSLPSFDGALYYINNYGGFWNGNGLNSVTDERNNSQDNGDGQPIVPTASTSRLSPPGVLSPAQRYTSDLIAPHGFGISPSVLPSPSPPSTAHSALFTPSALTLSTPYSDFNLDFSESDYTRIFGLPSASDAALYSGASREQCPQEAYGATFGGTATYADINAWREGLMASAPASLDPFAVDGLQALAGPSMYSDPEVPRSTAADMYSSWRHPPPSRDFPLHPEPFPATHVALDNWGSTSFVGDQVPANIAGWDPLAGTQSGSFNISAQGTGREYAPPVHPSPIYNERPAGSTASQDPARQRFVPSSPSSSRPATRKRQSSEEPEASPSKRARYSDPAQHPSTAGPFHFPLYPFSPLAGPSHAQPPVFGSPNPIASAPLPAPRRSPKRAREDDDDGGEASASAPASKRSRMPRGAASGRRKAPRPTRNTRRSSAIGMNAPEQERVRHRGRFACAIPACRQTFSDRNTARRHLLCVHKDNGKPDYQIWFDACEDEELREYLSHWHADDLHPMCLLCKRRFSRKDSMKRHVDNKACLRNTQNADAGATKEGKGKGKGKERER